MISRRTFNLSLTALAFAGLTGCGLGKKSDKPLTMKLSDGYGPLVPDPNKLIDLPEGFNYDIISALGDEMTDGFHVPDRADGMGCFALSEDTVALVRNHELSPKHLKRQPDSLHNHKTPLAYDAFQDSGVALPGGTSTLIYNLKTRQREQEFLSLVGTIRNCAGGVTPWGSWLTCEESVKTANGDIGKDHGYIFEVPASATGLVNPEPLKAMGRFNHEAAAVDPKTGIVYLTEDRGDSLFYRFIPNVPGQLNQGGKLQALVVQQSPRFDSRNWDNTTMALDTDYTTRWIDLTNPESPDDDLRIQGFENGAAVFARGEGIHWGDNEAYFCCTNGGQQQLGQIMRYQPSPFEGTEKETNQPGILQLILESEDQSLYNFGDNITVTPQGHLIVCEDQYTDTVNNHLRGVTPAGEVYDFANLHAQTELAGACFSPDGSILFVNIYSPTKTIAIRGPWEKFIA